MSTRLIVMIILQYIQISNNYVVPITLYNVMCQLYLNKIQIKNFVILKKERKEGKEMNIYYTSTIAMGYTGSIVYFRSLNLLNNL